MGIILDESSNPSQTRQRSRSFVSVNYAEFRHANGKFFVTAVTGVEDETVTGTVHRLQGPFLLLNIKGKHAVIVVLPMTRCLPKFGIVHIGRDDWRVDYQDGRKEAGVGSLTFLVTSLEVLGLGVLSDT